MSQFKKIKIIDLKKYEKQMYDKFVKFDKKKL